MSIKKLSSDERENDLLRIVARDLRQCLAALEDSEYAEDFKRDLLIRNAKYLSQGLRAWIDYLQIREENYKDFTPAADLIAPFLDPVPSEFVNHD